MDVGIIEPETETNGAEPHSPSAKAAASPSTNQETNSEPSQVKPEPEGEGVAKNEDKTPADNEGKPDPNDKATEVETPNEDLSAKQKQQLNQRELFLSKQVEILPATNIRGKCSVTLLNETESFSSYVDKEVLCMNAHYYTLKQIENNFVIRMLSSIHWCMTLCSELYWLIGEKFG